MNLIASLIAWIFEPNGAALQSNEEQFLARSVDICDLERRMRALDQGRAFGPVTHYG